MTSVSASEKGAAVDADPSDRDHTEPPMAADEWMRTLYRDHAGPLYRFLLGITYNDSQAAEDFLQETMLKAWRNLDGLGTGGDRVRPWLFTVSRRIAIDAARARNARPSEVGTADVARLPASDDPIERITTAHLVRQAMRALTSEQRSVLVEMFYRDASAAEAAARLGVPVGTVKSRTHYALRSLSAAIGAVAG
ncbi:sigma-70 family RNA polymerase sigma factor [Micromonospora sp. NPDC049559]|uniref:sigma-70 family RNA polymerase sigma factor n=1 Tax=Micromonospora sp. NPDC049559 TaxID=3155923 RepID=UPI0034182A0E